jgi:hypothetical protein
MILLFSRILPARRIDYRPNFRSQPSKISATLRVFMSTKLALKPENIAQLVFFIRGEKVMLDADLAKLYGVSTKALNQALRRNRARFPEDFVFQLTAQEFAILRSQFVTSNTEEPDSQRLRPNWSQFVTSSRRHRGAAYRPYAFAEHGALQAANVLRSPRAIRSPI